MKIIGIDDIEVKKKQLNSKKIIIVAVSAVIIITFIVLFCLYMGNRSFRDFTDKYIFMKNVTENNVVAISIDESENNNVYTYDKYISILSQNTLVGYNKFGNKEYELKMQVSNPIVDINNQYLLIGEKQGKKLYLVAGDNIVWEQELDGNISRVSVNKNGYVSVILSGTSYKSIIQVFDNNGKSLFKTYLNMTAVDSDISSDNKNLSFVEISTNGTLVQSMIETISIPKAKEQDTSSNSIIYKVKMPSDKVPLNLKYHDGNKLICMFNDSIVLIKNDTYEEIMPLKEEGKKITYSGIELDNSCFRIIEKNSILNSETTLEILNTNGRKTSYFVIDGSMKEVYCMDSVIVLNLGSEADFIGMNGWLIKKYTSNQEIRKIVVNSNFAGIVYRNKIEIVDL